MENAIDSALVHRFNCFKSLNGEQIAAFAAHLEEVRLSPGEVLFRQGDPGDAIYLLISGQMLVKLGAPTQDDRTLATLVPGAILGEMGPLVNTPRTATAVSNVESRLWRISTGAFHDALQKGDAWATSFLLAAAQVLGRRVMTMNEELVKLSAELHPNLAQPQIRKAVAEIEQLRKRLATDWTF
ncbi:MAG: cyclic nucleotide-binding domain-containing protein [Verrucomicrobia bacterium]|nr:cyclic nucleotide-binding domain-containing protein [Verrucomicrobiota bacterium]